MTGTKIDAAIEGIIESTVDLEVLLDQPDAVRAIAREVDVHETLFQLRNATRKLIAATQFIERVGGARDEWAAATKAAWDEINERKDMAAGQVGRPAPLRNT